MSVSGHPPDPLPADAPVGPVAHHVVDAVASPLWNPSDILIDDVESPVLGDAKRTHVAALIDEAQNFF